jgi:sigma-B regulation protein RsbU (phosphoserine phosphatase)
VLLRKPLDEKASRIVAVIQRSVARIAGLIDDVMDFTRGRLGNGLKLDLSQQPLDPVLRRVTAEARISFPGRTIETDIAVDDPVICDQGRIGQLLTNLLTNALTYGAPDKPVHVRAGVDGVVFELSVANAGDPIPPAAMERLFHPFTRGAVRPSQQGLGLGLFITSEIAQAHNGSINVVSSPEETRFTFRMPLAPTLPANPA